MPPEAKRFVSSIFLLSYFSDDTQHSHKVCEEWDDAETDRQAEAIKNKRAELPIEYLKILVMCS